MLINTKRSGVGFVVDKLRAKSMSAHPYTTISEMRKAIIAYLGRISEKCHGSNMTLNKRKKYR